MCVCSLQRSPSILSDRRQLSAPAGGAGGWWAVNGPARTSPRSRRTAIGRSVSSPNPALHRSSSQAARARRELGAFFGVNHSEDPFDSEKWNQRRLRMIARKFGNVKSKNLLPRGDEEVDSMAPSIQRIFSRDLRQPSRYGERVEKLNAISALRAGVKWKVATIKRK